MPFWAILSSAPYARNDISAARLYPSDRFGVAARLLCSPEPAIAIENSRPRHARIAIRFKDEQVNRFAIKSHNARMPHTQPWLPLCNFLALYPHLNEGWIYLVYVG